MVLITGSVARGLADESSDVDIYLYDRSVEAGSMPPDLSAVGALRFGVPTSTGWFAKLIVDGRYCDVEGVDLAALDRATEALGAGRAPPAWAVKIACGIRDAVAVRGADELARWQHRLQYRDDAAAAEVAARAGRLLAASALYELTWARGDVVSFTARIAQLLLDVIALLAAVNRRFVPVDDPKWLPWHVEHLDRAPDGTTARMSDALRHPNPDTMADLDVLVGETLDLVDAHVPGADTRSARFAVRLRPRPSDDHGHR